MGWHYIRLGVIIVDSSHAAGHSERCSISRNSRFVSICFRERRDKVQRHLCRRLSIRCRANVWTNLNLFEIVGRRIQIGIGTLCVACSHNKQQKKFNIDRVFCIRVTYTHRPASTHMSIFRFTNFFSRRLSGCRTTSYRDTEAEPVHINDDDDCVRMLNVYDHFEQFPRSIETC